MSAKREQYEVVIIGAGIAGASLAYFLARRGLTDVLLIEREQQAAYHASGRSAAALVELDADDTLQALKIMGGSFLREPPAGFSEQPLLDQCGVVWLFDETEQQSLLANLPALEEQGLRLQLLSPREVLELVPPLQPSQFAGGALLPADGGIDIHELLQGYLRHAKRSGAELRLGLEVTGLQREAERCTGVLTTDGPIGAGCVVDAAGAWAGPIAQLAEASPIDITPLRRCAATFAAPAGVPVSGWPLVWSEAHAIYFKPESGGLLFSPMDEHPSEPCDAQPSDLAIAEGFQRLAELAPALVPKGLRRSWAGLRSFAPDRAPVVGADPQRPGFFWLAGQGGCGIETSPALGAIAADLIATGKTERFDATRLSPARFLEATDG